MQERNKLQQILLSAVGHSWPLFLVIIILFALGVFFGTLGVNALSEDNVMRLTQVIDNFLANAPELHTNTSSIVQESLTDNLITWAVILFLGLTIIGIPAILFMVFMRGFTIGFSISFLAGHRAETGTLLALTAIVPHNLLLIPALFISSAAALSFALILLKRFFNTQIPVLPNFCGYLGIMLITGIAFSGAAVIETYVSPWLTRMASSLLTGGWRVPF